MTKLILRKLGWALLTIAFVLLLNFFLFRVMGDPTRLLKDPRLSQATIEAIRVRFGLDKPVINCFETLNPIKASLNACGVNPFNTQFAAYLSNLLKGDLGVSFHSQRPVAELLTERLWNTLLLIGAGQILAIIIGIILGLVAAWKARTVLDYSALVGSLTVWSLPTFWLGILLLFWGSNYLGLPLGGKETIGSGLTGLKRLGDIGTHLLLPTLTFTLVFIGEYMLIMRSTVLDVLSEDYILTAKAKGLSTFQILKDHALRNAMLPIVTIVALNLGFTVAGAIQIETVFSWPGLGLTIFEAVGRRDYPVLQGAFLLLAVSVVLANVIADLLYTFLDPRVRLA
ncbi:MAG: ABC transporter permease [Trueperaceae bacterium]|nr:ABC transporter permease [Trueperaceae bacterium]